MPRVHSVAGRRRHLQQVVKGLDLLAGVLEELARLPVVVGEFLTQLDNDVLGELGVSGPALQSALGRGQVPAVRTL